MKPAALSRLAKAAHYAEEALDLGVDAALIRSVLINDHGGSYRFNCGTYLLNVAGAFGSSTQGGELAIRSWLRQAQKRIEREAPRG